MWLNFQATSVTSTYYKNRMVIEFVDFPTFVMEKIINNPKRIIQS